MPTSPSPGSFLAPSTLRADDLHRRGSGCPNPALGCDRQEYTVAASPGYIQPGYDTGRWWMDPGRAYLNRR